MLFLCNHSVISLVFFGQPFFDSYFIFLWFFRALRSTFRSILAMPSPPFRLTCFSIFLLWFFALSSSVPQPLISLSSLSSLSSPSSPSSPSCWSALFPYSSEAVSATVFAFIAAAIVFLLPVFPVRLRIFVRHLHYAYGRNLHYTYGHKKGVSPSGETPLFDRIETIRIPKTSMRRKISSGRLRDGAPALRRSRYPSWYFRRS